MLVIYLISLVFLVYGTFLSCRRLKSAPPHLDRGFGLYPVSVLKPVKGADAGLEKNLESFFLLEYPKFELIFSVANAFDPALPIIQKLMATYPRVDARLLLGDVSAGINPKVNNLIKPYHSAKYDYILISDSNIRVDPDYLKKLVAHQENDTGVITAVVAGTEAKNFFGRLEGSYLNTFYARGLNMAFAVGTPCVIGKSMLFRRSHLDRNGGIEEFAKYIAEDNKIGEALARDGHKILLMAPAVKQFIGRHSFENFWQRHLRWARIRKTHAFVAFALEPLVANSIMPSLMAGALLRKWLETSFAIGFVLNIAVWALMDRRLTNSLEARSFRLQTWLVKEAAAMAIWLHASTSNRVSWRGSDLRIRFGGEVKLRRS